MTNPVYKDLETYKTEWVTIRSPKIHRKLTTSGELYDAVFTQAFIWLAQKGEW